jgi:phospholipid-binding lipoprotein MlaA
MRMRSSPIVLAALLAAAPAQAAPDPLEGVNRRIHAFNQLVRAHVLGPAAETYVAATSPGFRAGLGNALANLGEPISALSSVAAGEFERAANAAMRFGINTTLGLGGVRDAAAGMGFPRQPFAPADAACSWGVPSGPYLVLPLLGPSTLRDAAAAMATGAALSQAIGPEALLGWQSGEMFVGYAAIHAELQRIEATALDAYAVHRSIFLQRRAAVCPGDGTSDPAE